MTTAASTSDDSVSDSAVVRPARTSAGKHVVVVLVMLAAFAFSGAMLSRVVEFSSPWMALLAMLCFLGLARALEPLYRLKVPAALRPVRAWEIKGDVYRRLAVPAFGRCLRNTPLRSLNSTVYLSGGRPDPLAIRHQVESAEAIHFWAAVVLLPYMVFYCFRGQWTAACLLLVVQILGNVYPIMHLRFVRGRLDGALRRAVFRRPSIRGPT